jgi:hypothetical protein
MAKLLTVATGGLDDTNDAVDEIPGRPDPAGSIAYRPEFVDAGVAGALGARLSFDAASITAPGIVVPSIAKSGPGGLLVCYSGGEYRPVNNAHNFTFIVYTF